MAVPLTPAWIVTNVLGSATPLPILLLVLAGEFWPAGLIVVAYAWPAVVLAALVAFVVAMARDRMGFDHAWSMTAAILWALSASGLAFAVFVVLALGRLGDALP